jgi:hypothetical protein
MPSRRGQVILTFTFTFTSQITHCASVVKNSPWMMRAVYFKNHMERKLKIVHLCGEKQVSLIGRAASAYSYRYASKG